MIFIHYIKSAKPFLKIIISYLEDTGSCVLIIQKFKMKVSTFYTPTLSNRKHQICMIFDIFGMFNYKLLTQSVNYICTYDLNQVKLLYIIVCKYISHRHTVFISTRTCNFSLLTVYQ